MRLLYGMVVPLLAVVGFIIALAISGQTWLIIGVVVFLLIALAVVLFGLMAMLGETDEDEGSST